MTEVIYLVDISEIAIGSGQLFSSIVLGLMAVNYSKKVANIETERKNVEIRKEKVELITVVNDIRFELVRHASSMKHYTVDKDNQNISLSIFTKIANEYKKAKKQNPGSSEEKFLNEICSKYTGLDFKRDFNLSETSDSILEKDRELYKKCYLLLDTLEIRDDLASIQDLIKNIREALSYKNTRYASYDFIYAIETHLTTMLVFENLSKIVESIKKS